MSRFEFFRHLELATEEREFLENQTALARSGFPIAGFPNDAEMRCRLAQLVLRSEPQPTELVEYRCGVSRSGRSYGSLLGCLSFEPSAARSLPEPQLPMT